MHYLSPLFSILFICLSSMAFADGQPVLWLERSLENSEKTVLESFHNNFKNNYQLSELKADMMSKSSDAYEMDIFKYKSEQLQYISKQAGEENWKSDFRENLEDWTQYNYLRLLFAYPIERAQVTGDQKIRPLPATYVNNAFEKVPLQNEAALKAPVYQKLVEYYTIYKTSEDNNFEPYNSADAELNKAFAACNQFYKGQVQAYAMAQQLMALGPDAAPQNLKLLYKIFSKQNNDKALDEAVLEVCEERMNEKPEKKKKSKKKKKGKKAKAEKKDQPFTLTNLDGKEVYLSDFIGKVVYVDFWASWCGPCRQQFPHAKKLKESFSDKELKDIVFLYISSDNTESAWRNAIEKFEIDGTHVWSPSNIPTSAGGHFQVFSIPRYMLIDKDGEIADPNAKRPSMPGIKEDILNLLAK